MHLGRHKRKGTKEKFPLQLSLHHKKGSCSGGLLRPPSIRTLLDPIGLLLPPGPLYRTFPEVAQYLTVIKVQGLGDGGLELPQGRSPSKGLHTAVATTVGVKQALVAARVDTEQGALVVEDKRRAGEG